MAITGNWKGRADKFVGAAKWGTGVNKIHAVNVGEGRNIANTPVSTMLPSSILGSDHHGDFGENFAASPDWGYGPQTGTSLRPSLGESDNARPQNFPALNQNGRRIRSINNGAENTTMAKEVPSETVSEGWRNKSTDGVDVSLQPDPSQLVVQTSAVQLHKTRAGSQTPSGRANQYDAPITQTIIGKRVKPFSTGKRLYDMQPKEQTVNYIRPYWARTAGTGNVAWMAANEDWLNDPMTREIPAPADTGPSTPSNMVDDEMAWY